MAVHAGTEAVATRLRELGAHGEVRVLPEATRTAQHPVVWAAAGHVHAVFDTTYDELKTITDATEIDVV